MSARRGGSNVTIRDIAAKLGLTHTTVSRALNDHAQTNAETKVRVRAAARQLGYIPNSPAQLMRR
jgi:LacI family transcriptional regulator